MDVRTFDRITKRLAQRKLSRRQAIATGSTTIAAGLAATGFSSTSAQNATPVATLEESASDASSYLFVQSFQSGSITPTDGQDDRYTVRLDHGLGQTIYFGDRPSRDVGTAPTPQFLDGLGFLEDNPPNAALLVENGEGETDIAVVELFSPVYDPDTHGITYDVTVLESWQDDLEMGLQDAPAGLATLAPEFGTAHLFIDDCSDRVIDCCTNVLCGETGCECVDLIGTIGPVGYCWHVGDFCCNPCTGDPASYSQQCNATFSDCDGQCEALVGPGCW